MRKRRRDVCMTDGGRTDNGTAGTAVQTNNGRTRERDERLNRNETRRERTNVCVNELCVVCCVLCVCAYLGQQCRRTTDERVRWSQAEARGEGGDEETRGRVRVDAHSDRDDDRDKRDGTNKEKGKGKRKRNKGMFVKTEKKTCVRVVVVSGREG